MNSLPPLEHLCEFGYALLPGVFSSEEISALAARLTVALTQDDSSVLRSRGETYGSRDLARLPPEVRELPRHARLQTLIAADLGPNAGLVRALYFAKPKESAWSLPPHKDRTIAVRAHGAPSSHFRRPTIKAGVPHVEADEELLSQMLTLRIHLDAMTADNGPLSVVPGSHHCQGDEAASPVEIHCAAGDVLAMRPLLTHASSLPRPQAPTGRRVIHLELAPRVDLPDGYAWHSFNRVW